MSGNNVSRAAGEGLASIDCGWAASNDDWEPPEAAHIRVRPVVTPIGRVQTLPAGALTHRHIGAALKPQVGLHRGSWLPVEAVQHMPDFVLVGYDPERPERVATLHPTTTVLVSTAARREDLEDERAG